MVSVYLLLDLFEKFYQTAIFWIIVKGLFGAGEIHNVYYEKRKCKNSSRC